MPTTWCIGASTKWRMGVATSATSIENNTTPTKASAQPTPLLQTVTQTQTEYPIQSKDGNSGESKTWPPSQSTHKQTKWFETWIYTCTLFEKNTPVSSALIWLFVLGIFSKDLTTFSGPIQAIQVLKYFWKFRLFFTNQNIVRTSNYFMLTISHLCKYCPCLFSQTFWVYIFGSSNHPVYRHWDSISWLQIYIFVEDLTIILQPKILLELLVLHQSRTTQCQPKHLLNLLDCFKQPHKHRQNIQSNQRTATMAKAKPHHHQNQVVWNVNLHMYFVWEKYTRK